MTCRSNIRPALVVHVGLLASLLAQPVYAQPPGGREMCGDGTTATVFLPGLDVLPFGAKAPDDQVTFPNGCKIYALLVSGYERNRHFDELTFYKLAKFVAEHDGYVHYAWWNNLLKEYMAGPLHDVEVTVPIIGSIRSNPGGLLGIHLAGFVPRDFFQITNLVPKAIPEEDVQFQADADRMIHAIRQRNPDAIIVVAGHSMGGEAVARLGANTSAVIDLLAPIDPVGNRSRPVGNLTDRTFNWTRWRATKERFRGFRRADCVRNPSFPLVCQDFDPRLFHIEYRCVPGGVGPWLDRPPIPATFAPGICKGPIVDAGTVRRFQPNIRNLYHRYQRESVFPFDFLANEFFVTPGGPTYSQAALGKNGLGESDPNKTCAEPLRQDPRDPTLRCDPGDGHGEIVGFRGLSPSAGGAVPVGLQAQNWPADAQGRRLRLIEMVTAPSPHPSKIATGPSAWIHEPLNPNLDLVVDGMIEIVGDLLLSRPPEADRTPPATVATADPAPNEADWNNSDVTVDLAAGDEPGGSGVKEIEHALGGAQAGWAVTSGRTAQEVVTVEGTTTVTFFARDEAGNVEAPQVLDVRLDKTPPAIAAATDGPPNAEGWNRTDVRVAFPASDALSGLASSTPNVLVSTEGAAQEITGTATDYADNQATASVLVSIDKTPPQIAVTTPDDGAVYLLNASAATAYDCADALSGVQSCTGPVGNGDALDTVTAGRHSFTVSAADLAGNPSSVTHVYSVRYAFSGFAQPIAATPAVNRATGGRTIPVRYRLTDANETPVIGVDSFVSLSSAPVACGGGAPAAPFEPANFAGGTVVRNGDGHFVVNWKTDGAWRGCRVLRLTLADGTNHDAWFEFR